MNEEMKVKMEELAKEHRKHEQYNCTTFLQQHLFIEGFTTAHDLMSSELATACDKVREINAELKAQLAIAVEALGEICKHDGLSGISWAITHKALTKINQKPVAVVEVGVNDNGDGSYTAFSDCSGLKKLNIKGTLIVWEKEKE